MSYRISVQHVTKLLLLMGFAVVLLAGSSTEANTRSTCGYTFPHTATGTTDLIDALLCANQTTGESVIDLNGQVFSYSQSYNDYNGPTALPEITGQVRIQNGTIERTGSNPLRLLYVNNTGQLVLDNTTLQNGLVTNTSHDGGAVLNEGILTITSSLFQQNQAYRGGAIAGYGELLIYGSTFQQNTADLSAAIHHRYSSTFPPDFAPLIQGSLFQNNTAGGQGRILTFVGIPAGFSESQILRNTIFRDNESQSGWIVIVQNRSLLEGTHFLNNQATALYTSSNTQGELIINRSIFQGKHDRLGRRRDSIYRVSDN